MKLTALPYLPNLLSLSRVPLGIGMALAVYIGDWRLAALLLWIAIGTDVVDGRLARATKTSSQLGGVLDHGSDASFVTLALAALASHGWVPWLLPVLVPLAFLQYLLDSRSLAGQPLRASQLGRYNGIAYFVLAGFPVMQLALGLTVIPFGYFIYLGWGLVISTAISMTDRLVTLISQRRGGNK